MASSQLDKLKNKILKQNPPTPTPPIDAGDLSPIQQELLGYIDATATVGMILSLMEGPENEVEDALLALIDAGIVVFDSNEPGPLDSWVEETFSDFLSDDDLGVPADKLDSLLDEFISEDSDSAQTDQLDQLLDEYLEQDQEDWEAFDALPGELPGQRATSTAPKTDAPAVAPATRKLIQLNALPGDRLPAFLFELAQKKESCSIKMIAGKKSMVLDFYEGDLIKIVPRPLEPKTLLGVLLVVHEKMDKKYLSQSMRLRSEKGMLQAQALLSLGALPPKPILNMLRAQVEWRLLALLGEPTIGYRLYPPRVTAPAEQKLEWRFALFNAAWKFRPVEWIMRWATEHVDCVVRKNQVPGLASRGLRMQMAALFAKTIQDETPVRHYSDLHALKAPLALRSLYAFWRMGLINIYQPDGSDLEPPLETTTFVAQVEHTAPHATASPSLPRTKKKPESIEIDFESMLDPDALFLEATQPEAEEPSTPPSSDVSDKPPNIPTKKARARSDKKKLMEQKKKQLMERAKKEYRLGVEKIYLGSWKEALEVFHMVQTLTPEFNMNPGYLAAANFARSPVPEKLRETLAVLNQAKDLETDQSEIYYLYGVVHKAAGNEKKAFSYFHHVLDENPNHLGALREIRLYKLTTQVERKTNSGLLSRAMSRLDGKKKK